MTKHNETYDRNGPVLDEPDISALFRFNEQLERHVRQGGSSKLLKRIGPAVYAYSSSCGVDLLSVYSDAKYTVRTPPSDDEDATFGPTIRLKVRNSTAYRERAVLNALGRVLRPTEVELQRQLFKLSYDGFPHVGRFALFQRRLSLLDPELSEKSIHDLFVGSIRHEELRAQVDGVTAGLPLEEVFPRASALIRRLCEASSLSRPFAQTTVRREENSRKPKTRCEKCGKDGHLAQFCKSSVWTVISGGPNLPVVSADITAHCGEPVTWKLVLYDCGADVCLVNPDKAVLAGLTPTKLPVPIKIKSPGVYITAHTSYEIPLHMAKSPMTPKGLRDTVTAYGVSSDYDLVLSYCKVTGFQAVIASVSGRVSNRFELPIQGML
ncbi:Zinc finger CCHC-type [Carpediemonas membranifera]|uniref:Zinc finger CCHC-type n=1 Tax=Carpediemonas membranifera TaxID=201153 RepID=A0A8J6B954_9EUKA|nr:Zinc finger CCHC-type [Carpediemonas membranifera]|eukprot:KAG9395357.1 Zinc finger CCHC-type [Carpediemonas membranifera]